MAPFAIFLFSLLTLLHRVTPDPPAIEKNALLLFITKLEHDASYKWLKSESPCSWKGVFCDPTNTTVIQLILSDAKLTGEIQTYTIGRLSNLLVLSLRNNYLRGSIPDDFSDLTLNELYLQDNIFSGQLPDINSDDLDKFNVSNNDLNCSIPWSLSKFQDSAFSGNQNLCGSPLQISCNWSEITCPYRYERHRVYVSTVGTIGFVFLAVLGLLFLIVLCYLRKKIHKQSKQPPKPSSEAPTSGSGAVEGDGNKLVLLFDDRNDGFDCDELLQGSAEVLGKGSVGTSYKRVLEEKMMTVVVKRLRDVVVTKAEFESRMEVLGKMKNENVVPLRAYYYSEDEKWLVYDYMPAGSLSAHLHGCLSGTLLNWNHRMRIALCVARGVAYLHIGNVVHGNIKSSNVLLQQETNKDAFVSDYGLNTLFDTWSSPNHWVTGYWAPEVLRTQKFSLKSDVYSFGVLLLELLTGKAPNQASTHWNDFSMCVQWVVCEEPKAEIFDVELRRGQNMEEKFQMLRMAKDCVLIVPDQRPTMKKVVSLMEEMEVIETIIES
ncbi:hypothetical protein L1987_70189 [Smallanthus sonchifolius]|uniref:Uncharacterized protein n=1 Tax=Smallanthus sonchifolius TaxID=185202 RepID=A0ACB9ANZ9_9ASTR|nr:hypothetical protein L1987_70189 [Smallanthus sonchifolius]